MQKFALCMCSKQWKVGYYNLRASFGVPSLSDCRLYLNLCMMYKIVIIHNLIYFPVSVFVPRVTRSSANQLYVQPFARTNAYYYSFVPSTCSVWNCLHILRPPYIILAILYNYGHFLLLNRAGRTPRYNNFEPHDIII